MYWDEFNMNLHICWCAYFELFCSKQKTGHDAGYMLDLLLLLN